MHAGHGASGDEDFDQFAAAEAVTDYEIFDGEFTKSRALHISRQKTFILHLTTTTFFPTLYRMPIARPQRDATVVRLFPRM